MNRAQRRAAAKVKHNLREWPKGRPMPLPIALGDGQKAWTCSCGSGLFIISNSREQAVESFDKHCADAREAVMS